MEGTISSDMSAEEINALLLKGHQKFKEKLALKKSEKAQTPASLTKTSQDPGFFKAEWFTPKLLQGEKILEILHVGMWKFKLYKIFCTNQRLIVLKKFPKNLIDIDYKQIELVEYYTNVEWVKSLYATLFIALAFFFLTAQEAVMKLIFDAVGFIEPILNRGNLFGLSFGGIIIFLGLLFAGIYFFGLFFISLLGSLRILLYEQAPFDITTKMTPEIQDLIRFVEQQKISLDTPVGAERKNNHKDVPKQAT